MTAENSVNFVRAGTATDDIQALLNGFPPGHLYHREALYEDPLPYQEFEGNETLAHLMARAGLFKSVSDARRNNWNRPVPPGYSQFVVGKRKLLVAIVGEMPT